MIQLSSDGVQGTENVNAATVLGLVMEAIEDDMPSCARDLYEGVKKAEEPVIEPVKEEPAVEPVVVEPVVEPLKDEPVIEPVKDEPVVEPVAVEPVVEPVVEPKANKEEEKGEEEKKERWRFLKVAWGKAKKVTSNVTNLLENLTESDDDEEDTEY